MDIQEDLWQSQARPHRLVINVTRQWEHSDSSLLLVRACYGSRASEPVWSSAEALDGPSAGAVARAIVEADMARWEGTLWRQEPRRQSQASWEQYLGM